MPNLRFSFLYRDAGNYKNFASVVFANPENLPPETVEKIIRASCNADGCFDPVPWGLPNIRTQPFDPEQDHDWYEFEAVEGTEEIPTVGRTISAFLETVKGSVNRGW